MPAPEYGLLARAWAWLALQLRPHLVLCRVLVRDLSEAPPERPDDDDLQIRIASFDELRAAATAAQASGLTPDFVDAAEGRGDVCIAAFDQGQIVAYVWRSFSRAPHEDSIWVQVESPYWYTYKMHTVPAYRGRRLAGLLTRSGDQVCRTRGLRAGVGFVETHNYPSLHANRHAGARPVGFAGYLRVLGRVYPFRTPGAARHSFRFVRPDPADGVVGAASG